MGHNAAVARRGAVLVGGLILATTIAACTAPMPTPAPTVTSGGEPAQSEVVAGVVEAFMAEQHLAAVIVEVQVGDELVSSQAFGESLPGMPAATDMHFRQGAVTFGYVGTLLMLFVDDGRVTLDDTIDAWVPELPESDSVTLRDLAQMTSGYPDFETDPDWQVEYLNNPYHDYSYEERIEYAFSRPQLFEPGTSWSYSHTNYAILGHVLAIIGEKPLDELLQERVLDPMGLTGTTPQVNPYIPEPVLHAIQAERKGLFGIDPATPFTEESTYWSTSWGSPVGADQTSIISDLTKSAVAIGSGALLTEESYRAMTDSSIIGLGEVGENCSPSCFPQTELYNYGIGVVRSGDWMMQNPSVSGYSAVWAYNPIAKVAVSVVATYAPGAFSPEGGSSNVTNILWRLIAAEIAPANAPPMPEQR